MQAMALFFGNYLMTGLSTTGVLINVWWYSNFKMKYKKPKTHGMSLELWKLVYMAKTMLFSVV